MADPRQTREIVLLFLFPWLTLVFTGAWRYSNDYAMLRTRQLPSVVGDG